MYYRYKFICLLNLLLVACSNPEPRNPIVRKTETFLNESVKRNKLLYKEEKNVILDYIKKDSLNTYQLSKFGFWYTLLKKEKDTLHNGYPKKGDILTYNSEIKNLNNQVIYDSKTLGLRKYIVDKEDVITGLQEGFKLMQEGDVIKFIFQSHLVYGYLGDGNKIYSNEPLIYTVHLKKIITKNNK